MTGLYELIPILLAAAWLLPLGSFTAIVFFGPRMGRHGVGAGYVATGAIAGSFVLSLLALVGWLAQHPIAHGGHAAGAVSALWGDWYALGRFGSLAVTIGYYVDALTVAMFAMVTLISTCIHVYSFGYMHEELHEVTDSLVTTSDGQPLRRPGRFHRFYQYLSLFCFSMLGLVLAGNVAMVFVFWELVGICSYLLIGFYRERKSASNAANKAFIVNRVGDFGMLIGLAALWSALGTFAFGDSASGPGIFTQVRGEQATDHSTASDRGHEVHRADHPAAAAIHVPDGFVQLAARRQVEEIYLTSRTAAEAQQKVAAATERWRHEGYGYLLLVIAGLGIFCGCVGKSAQVPLHVWLPDAMEGPTPVSALIHAATMVAAGVYLVGRFYPAFAPEVLLVIAYTGGITLFLAATMAIVATDIKRVLAYSTVSQLGYMMLALGLGGWVAGLFHLLTHAFFKALLFLCSGSVIHACGTNEMPEMGGLRRKMPWTAGTMLVGCLAISGAGILGIGLSGYYSKDAILAQALLFRSANHVHGNLLFGAAIVGAAITAFYMFRLWFMTFAGTPRNQHVFEHAHESPRSMVVPLVILATFAVAAGWRFWPGQLSIGGILQQAAPAVTASGTAAGRLWATAQMPAEHLSHQPAIHGAVSWMALAAALTGFLLAALGYGVRVFSPELVARVFRPVYLLLLNKWWIDELYRLVFVRSVLALARVASWIDRAVIDTVADNSARLVAALARVDDWIDRVFVDRAVDLVAAWTYKLGLRLRNAQTGLIRQYVTFAVLGTVTLLIVVGFYWSRVAGP